MKYYDVYRYAMDNLSDPRVNNWPLMNDFSTVLVILATYFYVIKVAGPRFMNNRKPFSLKRTIQAYNIFQICSCCLLIYGCLANGWWQKFSLGCEPIDYSNDPMAVRLASWVWWTMILKFIELIETVFFVLRKKYNQVSNLHIYHHMSTFIYIWLGVKYIAGGMATFSILVNSFIHVIMYTYYLLATLGPEWQKTLSKWKNKITIMQIIQFFIVIGHSMQALRSDCDVPNIAALLFIPNVVLVCIMFFNFYKASYAKKIK